MTFSLCCATALRVCGSGLDAVGISWTTGSSWAQEVGSAFCPVETKVDMFAYFPLNLLLGENLVAERRCICLGPLVSCSCCFTYGLPRMWPADRTSAKQQYCTRLVACWLSRYVLSTREGQPYTTKEGNTQRSVTISSWADAASASN